MSAAFRPRAGSLRPRRAFLSRAVLPDVRPAIYARAISFPSQVDGRRADQASSSSSASRETSGPAAIGSGAIREASPVARDDPSLLAGDRPQPLLEPARPPARPGTGPVEMATRPAPGRCAGSRAGLPRAPGRPGPAARCHAPSPASSTRSRSRSAASRDSGLRHRQPAGEPSEPHLIVSRGSAAECRSSSSA